MAKEVEKDKGLAEKLRMGSLVEDRLSYRESFIVRCYEVGINKTATVETIANLLQVLQFLSSFSLVNGIWLDLEVYLSFCFSFIKLLSFSLSILSDMQSISGLNDVEQRLELLYNSVNLQFCSLISLQ